MTDRQLEASPGLACLLNETPFVGGPYSGDTDLITPSWDSTFYSSFTSSSSDNSVVTPKQRHLESLTDTTLSPGHQNKKRLRSSTDLAADSCVAKVHLTMPSAAPVRSSVIADPINECGSSDLFLTSGSLQHYRSVEEESHQEGAHEEEDILNNKNSSHHFLSSSDSAIFVRTSPLDYLYNKNSPQYQEIAQDLEDILDMQENIPSTSPRLARRRWRGLAPIPYSHTFPSEVYLQQQQQELSFRASCSLANMSLNSSLEGLAYPNGSWRRQESLCAAPPHTVQSSATKELRWKHQTDMLRSKFSKGSKNARESGTVDGGPPPLSAKSFITKWKLNA